MSVINGTILLETTMPCKTNVFKFWSYPNQRSSMMGKSLLIPLMVNCMLLSDQCGITQLRSFQNGQ